VSDAPREPGLPLLGAEARELLGYLRDLGWEDFYLDAAETPAEVEEPDVDAPPTSDASPGAAASLDLSSCGDLDALGAIAGACEACVLAKTRQSVVFGSGSPTACVMFVGEGPGAQEDRQGLPFVGPAGELLTKIIQAMEMDRAEVYIANVVKCRPPGNRDPQPAEVASCIGFLRRQIELVRPRVLVALGRVAAQNLLASDAPVGRMRGSWHSFEGVPLRVTYHPAALLRNEKLKRPTWEDMKAVLEALQQEDAS
jgi:DNA polymerase